MERKCIHCGETKDISEFYTNKRMVLGVESKCKKCAHKYQRDKRKLRWPSVFKYAGEKCAHCGLSEPEHPEIYDFHHKDPTLKERQIAELLRGSEKKLYEEIDKCVMICSNCHRKEHAKLRRENEVY